METKLLAHKVDFVKRMLQFKECFRVDSQGRSGGIGYVLEEGNEGGGY